MLENLWKRWYYSRNKRAVYAQEMYEVAQLPEHKRWQLFRLIKSLVEADRISIGGYYDPHKHQS